MANSNELAERVAKLEERDESNRGVLRKLAEQMESLAASVQGLRITIATAVGAASVAVPVLTWLLPKLMDKLWKS